VIKGTLRKRGENGYGQKTTSAVFFKYRRDNGSFGAGYSNDSEGSGRADCNRGPEYAG